MNHCFPLYGEFLCQLGGEPKHQEWILNNGYGYKLTVDNTRKMLKELKIDESVFCMEAKKMLMKDYTDFDRKIVSLLEKLSKKKNLMRVFGHIENKEFENYLEILNKRR